MGAMLLLPLGKLGIYTDIKMGLFAYFPKFAINYLDKRNK